MAFDSIGISWLILRSLTDWKLVMIIRKIAHGSQGNPFHIILIHGWGYGAADFMDRFTNLIPPNLWGPSIWGLSWPSGYGTQNLLTTPSIGLSSTWREFAFIHDNVCPAIAEALSEYIKSKELQGLGIIPVGHSLGGRIVELAGCNGISLNAANASGLVNSTGLHVWNPDDVVLKTGEVAMGAAMTGTQMVIRPRVANIRTYTHSHDSGPIYWRSNARDLYEAAIGIGSRYAILN